MKRLVCALLCILICIMCCACSGKGNTEAEQTSTRTAITSRKEVESYVKNGEIKGVDVRLHDDGEQFITDNKPSYFNDGEINYSEGTTSEKDTHFFDIGYGARFVRVDYDHLRLYYPMEDPSAGFGIIVTLGEAYGFSAGNCYKEDIITSLGEPDKIDIPHEDDLFFLLGASAGIERLNYNFGTYRLDFILSDGCLAATVLTDTEIYPDFGKSAEETTGGSVQ